MRRKDNYSDDGMNPVAGLQVPSIMTRHRTANCMPRLFLSYRRDDSAAQAGRLYDILSARFGRDEVFMDVEGIDAGQDYVDIIDRSIASCHAFLVVIGPGWLAPLPGQNRPRLADPGDVVRQEILAALKHGVSIIPVLVEGAEMPGPAQLPLELRVLSRRQAVELRDAHFHRDAEDLIASLDRAGDSVQPRRRKITAAVVSAILALAAGAGSYWYLATPARRGAASTGPPLLQNAVAGKWRAEINYGAGRWGGKTYSETFDFVVVGEELTGTASFLKYPRSIQQGRVRDGAISFTTKWALIPEGSGIQENSYRGRVSGNKLDCVYQDIRDSSLVRFTATRIVPAP